MDFWDFFLLMLIWIPLIMLWLFALTDLSRRENLSSVAKGWWAVLVVLLPIIGMILYFVLRPGDDPVPQDTAARYEEIRREAGLTDSTLDQLARLGDLRDAGALTEEEFQSMKAKLLA